MLYILTPARVANPGVLKLRKAPRKLIEKGLGLLPKGLPLSGMFWRIFLEFSFPRYLLALAPFPILVLSFPDMALPLAQAPALLFLAVYLVEYHYLSVGNPEKRKAMADETERARAMDLVQVRGRKVLTQIAAGRQMTTGTLHFVVEQSGLARVVPLTMVSVQYENDGVEVLQLSPGEERLIEATLFDKELDERFLHRVNISENKYLRSVELDPKTVSAHARLAAMAG